MAQTNNGPGRVTTGTEQHAEAVGILVAAMRRTMTTNRASAKGARR